MKKLTAKQAVEQADKYFSLIVRTRDGFCVECGTNLMLQCAHGFSRSYRPTRWDERNAWALCKGCHVKFTHRPIQWEDWMRARMGDDLYDEMRTLAVSLLKVDVRAVAGELRERWEAMAA